MESSDLHLMGGIANWLGIGYVMTEEKYAIFISLSYDCQLLDKGHYSIVL